MGMISFLNIKPKQVEAMKPENIVTEEPKQETFVVEQPKIEIQPTIEEPKEEVKETSTRRRRRN